MNLSVFEQIFSFYFDQIVQMTRVQNEKGKGKRCQKVWNKKLSLIQDRFILHLYLRILLGFHNIFLVHLQLVTDNHMLYREQLMGMHKNLVWLTFNRRFTSCIIPSFWTFPFQVFSSDFFNTVFPRLF